jgi:hypothetical protein
VETKKLTEDAKYFGENVWVYCNQHLNPHMTGWCTVDNRNKILLEAKTAEAAGAECKAKGYTLFKG